MNPLFPLRPVQIVDISFQLLRKRFVKTFAIALAVTLPLQALLWILEASLGDVTASDISARTILVIAIVQFSAVGIALTVVSNILSKSVGRSYCHDIFEDFYHVQYSPSRVAVALYHIGVQVGFVVFMIGSRFLIGRILVDNQANTVSWFILVLGSVPWVFITLRMGFAVPISTHEGGTFKEIRKRTKQLNRFHFFKLFGVYCTCIFMIFILVVPSLTVVQIILAKNVIKTDLGGIAFTNLIVAVVIASISAVYSYILTVTYFNARIENEGFDISIAIQQAESEGSTRGKLLDPVA